MTLIEIATVIDSAFANPQHSQIKHKRSAISTTPELSKKLEHALSTLKSTDIYDCMVDLANKLATDDKTAVLEVSVPDLAYNKGKSPVIIDLRYNLHPVCQGDKTTGLYTSRGVRVELNENGTVNVLFAGSKRNNLAKRLNKSLRYNGWTKLRGDIPIDQAIQVAKQQADKTNGYFDQRRCLGRQNNLIQSTCGAKIFKQLPLV